jgi:hypothetical protein
MDLPALLKERASTSDYDKIRLPSSSFASPLTGMGAWPSEGASKG